MTKFMVWFWTVGSISKSCKRRLGASFYDRPGGEKKPTLYVFLIFFCLFVSAANVYAVPFPGPDSFGYTGTAIPLNLRDVSVTGTDVGLDSADDAVAVVPIGFTFEYYGVSYTQVEISSNGFITFSPTGNSECCSGESIPNTSSPNNYIAGWWEDLDPGAGGIIRTGLIGAPGSRVFVVGFYNVRDYDDPTHVVNTFEIILHEGTNDIELAIQDIQFDDVDNKVVGIENLDGTDGIEIIYVTSNDPAYSNGDSVISNQGYYFSSPKISSPEINLKVGATDVADGGTYDFGSQYVGTNTDVTFTIENTGTANLTLTTPITIGGADAGQFSIQQQPVSPVAPSGTTTFIIRLSPTSTGTKTASISIANNDSDENPYDLTITGQCSNVPAVPTINEWGMIILFLLIAGMAIRGILRNANTSA
jgi:hypothetical protein